MLQIPIIILNYNNVNNNNFNNETLLSLFNNEIKKNTTENTTENTSSSIERQINNLSNNIPSPVNLNNLNFETEQQLKNTNTIMEILSKPQTKKKSLILQKMY